MNWSIEEFNLGSITAFGDAKIGGFSGTKEQFYSLIKKVARGAYLIDIDKSTTTLDSGDWSSNQYDLTSVYPTNKYKIFSVTLDYDNATSSQIDAWNNGDITLCDGNILKALGDVPLVDLPIVVVFQGLIVAVEVPVLSGSLVFDGTEQTPTFTGYDPNTMIMGGDTAETNAGDYTAAFTPRTGYMWSDGTTGVKFVSWSIAKAVVTAPTVTANLTYDGTEQTATVSSYDPNFVSVTGITGTNAGTYTATVSLIDNVNTEWTNGSTDDITYEWVIAKISVTAPTVSSSLVYDGTEQTATVSVYDPNLVRVTGITGTNAGDYTATVVLLEKSNHEWSNGTTEDIKVIWNIARATGYITLSDTNISISDEQQTYTVTFTSTGSVTATSSDTSIATANVSENSILIQIASVGISGKILVTVNCAQSQNYTSAFGIITVSANYQEKYTAYWDGTSTQTWTREDNAEGLTQPTSTKKINGRITQNGSSPFDDIMPWAGMVEVEDENAGTLVAIPKFFYIMQRVGENGIRISISDKYFNGSMVSPLHRDRGDGYGERDIAYVGKYLCNKTNYKSETNAQLRIDSNLKTSQLRTSIHNLGSDIWIMDYSAMVTIQLLYLVEYASWDVRNNIGFGQYTGNPTGNTDEFDYHTAFKTYNNYSTGYVKYRNIEGLWSADTSYPVVDGITRDSNNILYIIDNPNYFGDISKGISTGVNAMSNGSNYIVNYEFSNTVNWFMYPRTGSYGSYSTYVGDSISVENRSNQSNEFFSVGYGSSSNPQNSGWLFKMRLYGGQYSLSRSFRLMKLPNNV